jgi:hypothetical protein
LILSPPGAPPLPSSSKALDFLHLSALLNPRFVPGIVDSGEAGRKESVRLPPK